MMRVVKIYFGRVRLHSADAVPVFRGILYVAPLVVVGADDVYGIQVAGVSRCNSLYRGIIAAENAYKSTSSTPTCQPAGVLTRTPAEC